MHESKFNFSQNIEPKKILLTRLTNSIQHSCDNPTLLPAPIQSTVSSNNDNKTLHMREIVFENKVMLGAYCPYCNILFLNKKIRS